MNYEEFYNWLADGDYKMGILYVGYVRVDNRPPDTMNFATCEARELAVPCEIDNVATFRCFKLHQRNGEWKLVMQPESDLLGKLTEMPKPEKAGGK